MTMTPYTPLEPLSDLKVLNRDTLYVHTMTTQGYNPLSVSGIGCPTYESGAVAHEATAHSTQHATQKQSSAG